jgi:ribose transport system permease protein
MSAKPQEITTPRARSGPRGGFRMLDYGIVLSFVALFIGLSIASPAFLTTDNLLNVLDQTSELGLIACGVTLVVIAGGFDLSVGAIFAVGGVVAALVANATDPVVGLFAGALAGCLVGIANGAFVALLQINAFVATLASGFILSGIAVLLTKGLLVTVDDPAFGWLGSASVGGLKVTVILFVIVAVVSSLLLSRTHFGRYIYAVGGNPDAARLSGVRVGMTRIATFALSGLFAGMAGLIEVSRTVTARADAGGTLALEALAAVVIGGTSIMGGQGAIWRTVLGVFLLGLISNGFNILGINPFYRAIAEGLIILIAVAADGLARRSRSSR